MLPSLKQRLIIFIAVLVGGWCWLLAEPGLLRADAGPGISLLTARSGLALGLVYLVAAGLPALALGVLASGAAHPLAGLFSISFALAVLALAGGPIDGLLWQADGAGVYLSLAVEMLLWAAALIGVLVLVARTRLWTRRRFPRLITADHFGATTRLRPPGYDALLAGVICATAGGLLAGVLLKSTDSGQVFGALILGFMVAALIACQIVPQTNPTAILLSPCAVAAAAYLYTFWRYGSHEALMATFHGGELPALARALPIHYASAAVAGCVLGVALAQSIEHARAREAAAETAE